MNFDTVKPEYTQRLAAMKVFVGGQATSEAKKLLLNRDRFINLQNLCGVPALWVMPVFYRENPSFSAYLGNGDPLDKPTVDVPEGRGPFDTWELGAEDALTLDHITRVTDWSWERGCYAWELYNGIGPRRHGRTSGYLWAGSDQYKGGEYVGDHNWSPGTWDHRIGCVALAKAIAALDAEIGRGFQ